MSLVLKAYDTALDDGAVLVKRSDVLRTTESDSDDEEEYEIKRNKFGALIYGLKPAPYLNCMIPDGDTPGGYREDGVSYHWDKYQGVFEHMARVYSVPLQGAYNLPSYAQPQYDQCYQQYSPPPPQYQQQQDDDE
ncbi:hypothetical protein Tco_0840737 [Tanacetum coccineum]|uniref:Uncharacterized protein n=1 Tax=Tanacetum coccineum TaxID=301880 RepID=A0ABQ5AUF6_9ASTR